MHVHEMQLVSEQSRSVRGPEESVFIWRQEIPQSEEEDEFERAWIPGERRVPL